MSIYLSYLRVRKLSNCLNELDDSRIIVILESKNALSKKCSKNSYDIIVLDYRRMRYNSDSYNKFVNHTLYRLYRATCICFCSLLFLAGNAVRRNGKRD